MICIGGLLIMLSMRMTAAQGLSNRVAAAKELNMRTTSAQEDGWIMNITSITYGFPWIPADKLSDRNSTRFKEAESFFCGKINEIFQLEPVAGNPVKERYVRCFICSFKESNLHYEAPVSFTYSLVFNGSDPVPKPVVDGMIASNTEIYNFGNKVWNLIGDWLVNRIDVTMIRVNLSDYFGENKNVNPNYYIDIDSVVELNVDLINFTLTPELKDPTSPAFTKLATSVCKDISRLVHNYLPSHKRCDVTSIVNNTVEGRVVMPIHLTFGWDKEVIYPAMIVSLIVENTPRQIVNNTIALNIGPVHVLERSLMAVTNRNIHRLDSNDTPINKSDIKIDNPCFPDKTNVKMQDKTNPSAYILCLNGNNITFTCDNNEVFDRKTSKCVKRTTVIGIGH